jgi:hypothetical protein
MEHYNRASASKQSVRIETTIENNILTTPQSKILQNQILQHLHSGNFFLNNLF